MDCEQFSCELGKIIIQGINPDLKTGSYKIMYDPIDKSLITISFEVCEEGCA